MEFQPFSVLYLWNNLSVACTKNLLRPSLVRCQFSSNFTITHVRPPVAKLGPMTLQPKMSRPHDGPHVPCARGKCSSSNVAVAAPVGTVTGRRGAPAIVVAHRTHTDRRHHRTTRPGLHCAARSVLAPVKPGPYINRNKWGNCSGPLKLEGLQIYTK